MSSDPRWYAAYHFGRSVGVRIGVAIRGGDAGCATGSVRGPARPRAPCLVIRSGRYDCGAGPAVVAVVIGVAVDVGVLVGVAVAVLVAVAVGVRVGVLVGVLVGVAASAAERSNAPMSHTVLPLRSPSWGRAMPR